MNDEIDPQNITETQAWPDPLDVIRQFLQDVRIPFLRSENT
jgi:hypothetical protein